MKGNTMSEKIRKEAPGAEHGTPAAIPVGVEHADEIRRLNEAFAAKQVARERSEFERASRIAHERFEDKQDAGFRPELDVNDPNRPDTHLDKASMTPEDIPTGAPARDKKLPDEK